MDYTFTLYKDLRLVLTWTDVDIVICYQMYVKSASCSCTCISCLEYSIHCSMISNELYLLSGFGKHLYGCVFLAWEDRFTLLGLWDRKGIVVACCLSLSVHPLDCLSFRKLNLVHPITRHRFELESLNLQQTRITEYCQLQIGIIDPDLQGHFGHFD